MSYADTFEPEPEVDELVQIVGGLLPWAIVAAFCIWAGWAWLADGVNALSLLLAVVFGLFQIVTNVLAVWIRALSQRNAWVTTTFALGAMVITGLMTHESLDHAYAVTQAKGYATADPQLMSWLLLAVPYLEPLMFWIRRLLSEPKPTAQPNARKVGILTALWFALFGTGGPALASELPRHPEPEPAPGKNVVRMVRKAEHRNLDEPARAQARLMARQGMKPKAIFEATGVPLSTCKRWARAA